MTTPFFKVKLRIEEQYAIEWDGTKEMYDLICEFDRNNHYYIKNETLLIIHNMRPTWVHKTDIIIFGTSIGEEYRHSIKVMHQKEYYGSGMFFNPFKREYERLNYDSF